MEIKVKAPEFTSHPHPKSAGLRQSVDSAIVAWLKRCKLELFRPHIRNGSNGFHFHDTIKDTSKEQRFETPSPDDVIYIQDHDWKMPMKSLLYDWWSNPLVLISTIIPESLSGHICEQSFYWDSKQFFSFYTPGSDKLTHKLWNWGAPSSTVSVLRKKWRFLPAFIQPKICRSFDVELKRVVRHRYVVALYPISEYNTWWHKLEVLIDNLLGGTRESFKPNDLERIDPTINSKNLGCINVYDGYEHFVSIKDPHCQLTLDLPYPTMVENIRLSVIATKPARYELKKNFADDGLDSISKMSADFRYYWELYGLFWQTTIGDTICIPRPETVRVTTHNTTTTLSVDTQPDDGVTVIPSNEFGVKSSGLASNENVKILDQAVGIARGDVSDILCHKFRIADVTNDKQPPKRFRAYRTEFVKEFLKIIGTLEPFDYDDIARELKKNSNNTQALKDMHVWFNKSKMVVKSFQKVEAYPDIKPPRNISTFPQSCKVWFSAFTLALGASMGKLPWYSFKMAPKNLTNRIHELCKSSNMCMQTDYSKFDGTRSKFLKKMEESIYVGVFPKYAHTIRKFLSEVVGAKGIMKFGKVYEPLYTRCSGSPDTSLMNTICNAFIAYCIHRENGGVPNIRALGLFGGDDGLIFDVKPTVVKKTVDLLGLLIKIDKVSYKGDDVGFLGRIFLDPWNTTACIADVRRALGKIHLYSKLGGVTPELAIQRKADAYSITDPKTPLLSHFCAYIQRNFKRVKEGNQPDPDSNFYVRMWGKDAIFPFNVTEDYVMKAVAENLSFDGMKITPSDVMDFIKDLQSNKLPTLPVKPRSASYAMFWRGVFYKKGDVI